MTKKKAKRTKWKCSECSRSFDTKRGRSVHYRQKHEPSVSQIQKATVAEMAEIIGDEELAMFFLEWLNNGRDAQAAYLKLSPNVSKESAAVLGHRWLKRVNQGEIMAAFGLGPDTYFQQLDEGLRATKQVGITTGVTKKGKPIIKPTTVADHKVRRPYHEALGKILRIEDKESGDVNVSVKVQKSNSDWLSEAEVQEGEYASK